MPLLPAKSMANWQLACALAGWELAALDHPERPAEIAEIRGVLVDRGKTESDICQMLDLVYRARRWLNPPGVEFEYVVGDADDLYRGLVGEASSGRLSEAEGKPLLDLLDRHMG
jgi:hypothetical protein